MSFRSFPGIPDALGYHDVMWAKAIVSIGAMICMSTAIIGTIYAVSRVIFAMAEDGLLPRILQKTFRQVKNSMMAMDRFPDLSMEDRGGSKCFNFSHAIDCYPFQVPIISMVLCTIFAAATAVVFNVDAIIEMLSVGTLFAYLLVAFAVLIVRHTSDEDLEVRASESPNTFKTS